jgi:hypothetical protein
MSAEKIHEEVHRFFAKLIERVQPEAL